MVQHIIMLPHIIMAGMPDDIIDIMRLQHSMNMSLSMPSIGIISQAMPFGVILHVILPIIICIMGIIIGFIIGMPPIIEPIIGFIMGFIIGIAPIIGIPLIMGFIIGIMFIAGFIVVISRNRPRFGLR
ncbi:hypothetical protein [Rhizobium sp. WW_1]|jgi:hypothetical protein|uniref:hypothetical protein n=1 Tax=Rhizobium sp. WW_1 TaxID=1907375 RepID=UPI000647C1FD|nr:hypothetical protein [Rhizobium sp. WW_1]RKD60785.1 hypothetical protein BJ928_10871 [Rhizobium sp. WW_1]